MYPMPPQNKPPRPRRSMGQSGMYYVFRLILLAGALSFALLIVSEVMGG